MSYDPQARRATPLAAKLAERIRRDGPITVHDYMTACLTDPDHGYYRTRDAIGRGGDFVTAPEISQVYGELIGLWAAVVWQQIGRPAPFALVELGPGRGTLMADALRATRIVPGFAAAARVHLVEVSEALRRIQSATLGAHGAEATWHEHVTQVPAGPAIVIANEFVDALPVEQFVRQDVGWRSRAVDLDAVGCLAFSADRAGPVHFPRGAPLTSSPGTIFERRTTMDLAFGLARLAKAGGMGAVVIDYGHTLSGPGDTLQAVRAHRFEHPLTSPGEADLTAQVDFSALADSARSFELAVDGPVTQAEFLGSLGIVERASRLMASNPAQAAAIEAGVARLLAPGGMGSRFRAIGVRSSCLPPLPGLPPMDKSASHQ